jgi:hypothetical protein
VLDRIKDWSGVLTFVIAALYTYPLGVWDRFVVTAKQEKSKEVGDLRSIILKLTEADSELIRAYASITDIQAQASLTQVANARKAALLAPNVALVGKHYAELTGAELELIGYQLNQLGDQGTLVTQIFAKAAEKMVASKNNLGAADTYRVQAGLYGPFGSLGPDIQKTRDFMQKAVGLLLLGEPSKSLSGAVALAMDWTNYEAMGGSWPCAEQMAKWLISQYQYINPAYAQSLQSQFAQMATNRKSASSPWLPVNQDTNTCSKDIFPWKPVGWPWVEAK